MQSGALRVEVGDSQGSIPPGRETADVVSLMAHRAGMVLIDGKWVRDFDTYGSGDLMSFDSEKEDKARVGEK